MSTSSYIFPDPSSLPAIPTASIHEFSILSPRSSAISTQPDDNWKYSLSTDISHSSGHFSLTSDRSSLHSLSDEETSEHSQTAELLAEGITIRTNRRLLAQPLSVRPLKTHRQRSVPIAQPQTPTKTTRQGPAPSITGQQMPTKSWATRVQTPMSTHPSQPLPLVIAPPLSPPPFIIAPCSPPLKHTVSSPSAARVSRVKSTSPAPIIPNPPPSPPPFIIAPCSPPLKHTVSSPSAARVSCIKSTSAAPIIPNPPPSPPPFIIAPCSPRLKHTVSSPSAVRASHIKSNTCQLYGQTGGVSTASRPRSRVENAGLLNPVQISMSMRGTEQGVSITNHIYLMSDSRLTGCPNDADSERVSMEICAYLHDLSLHSMTMDEIWRCIDQVDGYGPLTWQAILVKLGIPEERIPHILAIMARASNESKILRSS
ncbi:uncharacterized protein HD556DRAFT_774701 [Suillus plorans]|uniref:Uncharacterized protein n=1 Tax=Suillus plorans TaxID=116603 RepID=A0A9P7AHJ7_9AGAM|nr:uncharacterized protein HD556DRAFT_774701 [Suillus plorans]KAG1789507.1 hypothetical protein HD556DRAFT_774701 [Suillus plorans]